MAVKDATKEREGNQGASDSITVDESFQNGGPEVKKKIDDVRLLESRKSARLIGHGSNTDFSKLADFNIVHERKRINSETNSETSGSTRYDMSNDSFSMS